MQGNSGQFVGSVSECIASTLIKLLLDGTGLAKQGRHSFCPYGKHSFQIVTMGSDAIERRAKIMNEKGLFKFTYLL